MLEGLKSLKINRPLICDVKRMPEYLMYVKDAFSSKKPIAEKDAERLNDICTPILQSQPPPKENDPGSFTLPCPIGNSKIKSALADLGASINVMPFSMFKKLQIGNLQPTNMMVEMADMTKKSPNGIIENVLVQIDKFIFPVDFVIIDMVEYHNVPLILGRRLLATAHAHIDVFNRQILLGVGEERVSFEINEPMDDRYVNYESVSMIRCSRETHEEKRELLLANDPQSSFTKMKKQSCIVNTNEKSKPFIQQLNPLPGINQSSKSSIKMGKKSGEVTSPPRGNEVVLLTLGKKSSLASHHSEKRATLQNGLSNAYTGRQRQIRNKDLRTKLEYFSEDYDEEREMEPRPRPTRETTPPLRLRSPGVSRQRERVVEFKKAPNREGSRAGRNAEGSRPLKIETRENRNREMNIPSLLATHLGINESGQPLQSSLTSVYGGHQPNTNTGGISLLTIRFSHIMPNLSYLIVCIYPLDLYLLMLTPTPNHLQALLMGNL
ncbi:hypothetical protein Tco_0775497 [Tanacetum coccineum]